MKKNSKIIFKTLIMLSLISNLKAILNPLTDLSFKKDINCSGYDLQDLQNFKNGLNDDLFASTTNDEIIPVPELGSNGDYVRAIASYNPSAGTPVNLLPGALVYAQPVNQVVQDYYANRVINKPVGYEAGSAISVGKVISTGNSFANYDDDFIADLNKYYGSSTINNRGSLIINN
jgi:hypothetical protein